MHCDAKNELVNSLKRQVALLHQATFSILLTIDAIDVHTVFSISAKKEVVVGSNLDSRNPNANVSFIDFIVAPLFAHFESYSRLNFKQLNRVS